VKFKEPALSEVHYRNMNRAQLEGLVHGVIHGDLGPARAELVRRDREYTDAQERDRREWETTHQAARQKFEEELAQRQMDHAAALAKEQLDTAQSAARAARMAAWAAAASAVGAIGQVIVAIFVK
jgi:hypothetical protein